MSLASELDIFGPGAQARALAQQAFGGRGYLTAVRRRQPDGSWLGPSDAIDLGARGLIEIPYAFGEPEEERRRRLVAVASRPGPRPSGADAGKTEDTAAGTPRIPDREPSVMPTPVGEPQGLDTIAFFVACRLALPAAHLVVDLECLGHKLGQLCLSFGADELVGSIVAQRELRLGPRASSTELTRDEAAALLRAAGFAPYERLPEGKVRPL